MKKALPWIIAAVLATVCVFLFLSNQGALMIAKEASKQLDQCKNAQA